MKRLIAVLLTVCALLALTIPVMLPAFAAEDSYLRGDADNDGIVSVLDATAIQRKLAEFSVRSFNEAAADVDGDGLNILDATAIQRYLAGFENIYGIDERVDVTLPATEAETDASTAAPTEAVTDAPTEEMTQAPTQAPTQPPTQKPTRDPDELPFVPAR